MVEKATREEGAAGYQPFGEGKVHKEGPEEDDELLRLLGRSS